MTSQGRKDVTSPRAQEIHSEAWEADPDHDRISCWCCCLDCDFDAEAVWDNDEAEGVESV